MENSATPSASSPLARLLAARAFPPARLPAQAELLVLVAAAAAAEEHRDNPDVRAGRERFSVADRSSQKAHAYRRSQVHFKCDNSAKV